MTAGVHVRQRSEANDRPSVKRPGTLQEMATLLGRKWHMVILYTLLESGGMGFNELKRETDGISGKMLSESLETLETEYGLVEREIVNDSPVRVEYSLSQTGESLEPILVRMNDWGRTHLPVGRDR